MIPWTVAHQTPLSMEFSRQEYWSGLPFPSPVDLPDPGIEPGSPTLQADSLLTKPLGKSLGCTVINYDTMWQYWHLGREMIYNLGCIFINYFSSQMPISPHFAIESMI